MATFLYLCAKNMIIPIKALVVVYFTKAFIVCFYFSTNAQSPLAALFIRNIAYFSLSQYKNSL